MNAHDSKYWISFTKITNIGPVRLTRLMDKFGSGEAAWNAALNELRSAGIEEKIAHIIIDERRRISPEKEYETLREEGVFVSAIFDENYPRLLKEIHNPPPLLFYRGQLKQFDCTLGVVGTRKITSYGKLVTRKLVYDLASAGMAIVSGLALGVDAEAHSITLEAKGTTIAVLGGGLDRDNIYPVTNRNLAEKIIASGGALVSEYPCGTRSLKEHFPQRNRIISGISLGVLVIEAPLESGSLITAKFALEQNREVFAVPGNIQNECSTGANALIKMGAHPVTSADDIMDALNITAAVNFKKNSGDLTLTPDEEKIMQWLSREPIHIDELIRTSKLGTAKTQSILSLLEIKGAIKNIGGGMYGKI